MAIRNKTTNLYTEWKPLIISLGDEDAGKVFKSIFNYQSGEDVFYSNPVWEFIKSKIDEYNNKLNQISEKRKENGKLGGLAKASKCHQVLASDGKCSNKIKENKTKENNINKEKQPPTLDDIKKYIQEKHLSVDAQAFFDYYEAGDWTDSQGKKVNNWKQKMLSAGWIKEKKEPELPMDMSKYDVDKDPFEV